MPIYIYKTFDTFVDHMGQYVRETLQEGLFGWQVTDCIVTMIDSGYRADIFIEGIVKRRHSDLSITEESSRC